jgi:hypothetical protein
VRERVLFYPFQVPTIKNTSEHLCGVSKKKRKRKKRLVKEEERVEKRRVSERDRERRRV